MLSYLIVDPDPETRMDPTPTRDVGIEFGIDFKKVESKLGNFVGKIVSFWIAPKRFLNPDSDPETRSGIPDPVFEYTLPIFFYVRLKFLVIHRKIKNLFSISKSKILIKL